MNVADGDTDDTAIVVASDAIDPADAAAADASEEAYSTETGKSTTWDSKNLGMLMRMARRTTGTTYLKRRRRHASGLLMLWL